jgi:hypothetical protein
MQHLGHRTVRRYGIREHGRPSYYQDQLERIKLMLGGHDLAGDTIWPGTDRNLTTCQPFTDYIVVTINHMISISAVQSGDNPTSR